MDDLTNKLRALGINRTPSTAELAKLVQTREAQRERGRALAASRGPVNANQLATLLWAKDNKATADAYKQTLGARRVPTTMIINGKVTPTTKYIVPKANQATYSAWVKGQVSTPYIQKAQAMLQSSSYVQQLQASLQSGANPQYLTQDGKVYVKRILAAGQGSTEVNAWLEANQGRATRYGRIDLVNGKVITSQSKGAIIPPAGIAPIPPRKQKLKTLGTKRARA